MRPDRRRFLQGAVLGVAGAPLLARAAVAAGPGDPGDLVLSGRLTGRLTGRRGDQLRVRVAGRQVTLHADRSTSVWRGGGETPSPPPPGGRPLGPAPRGPAGGGGGRPTPR